MKKVIYIAVLGAMSLALLVYKPITQAAGDVRLYLSPASASVASGETLTLNLREDSGAEPINAVSTHIYYSSSSLQFLSFTPSSQFNFPFNSFENGVINVSQGASPPLTGDQLVATIKFKVLASSGNLSITVDPIINENNSSVLSYADSSNILTAVYGGSYGVASAGQSPNQSSPPSTPSAANTAPSDNQTAPAANINLPSEAQGLKNARETSITTQTDTSEGASRLPDETVLLSIPPAIILTAIASRYLSRKYGFMGKPHYAKESIANVAKRINRSRIDPKKETVAELAARMRRQAKKSVS